MTRQIGLRGTDKYSWGDHDLYFVRCASCGCVTHYETRPGLEPAKIAVNTQLLDEEQKRSFMIRQFDGKHCL